MNSLLGELLNLKSKLENIEQEVKTNTNINLGSAAAFATTGEPSQTIEEKLSEYLANKDKTINLNIGGKIFKTTEKTLSSFEGSLFHTLITKAKEENNGELPRELFFDRSPRHFPRILNLLRTR